MKLQVIVGSTRQGRASDRIAKWVVKQLEATRGVQAELVDLRDFEMPFFDEAISPQFNQNRAPVEPVKRWLEKLGEADGYVVVTPEYNRSYTAVLKNALDYVDFQMARKPVALVAHGTSGGAQAVAHLRGVLPGLLAVTVSKATFIVGSVADLLDENGDPNEDAKERVDKAAGALQITLGDLQWYAGALQTARSTSTK